MSELGNTFDQIDKNGIINPIMFHPLYGGGDSTIKTYEFEIPNTTIPNVGQYRSGTYSATGTVTSKKLFETNMFVVLEHQVQMTNTFGLIYYPGDSGYWAQQNTVATGSVTPSQLSSENLSTNIKQEQELFENISFAVTMASTWVRDSSYSSSGTFTINGGITGALSFIYPNEYLFPTDGRYIFQSIYSSNYQNNINIACSNSRSFSGSP